MLMVNFSMIYNMFPLISNNDLQRIFEKLDKNGDGLVSLEELNWLLERIGVQFSLEELESLVGKPCLDFDEFLFFYDSISNQNVNGGKKKIGSAAGSEEEVVEEEAIIHGGEEEEEEAEEETSSCCQYKRFSLNIGQQIMFLSLSLSIFHNFVT
ncbi:hypothetical protein DITRI_Ditri03aG0145000 [Diplodiscus trichospermus]